MSDGVKNWPYGKTFDAIAAATKIEDGTIVVSVVKFAESFGEYPGEPEVREPDCEFIAFKKSGKYYTSGKGFYPTKPEGGYLDINRWTIAKCNDGRIPGLSSLGGDFTIVVNPLPNCTVETAHPRALLPEEVQ